MAYTTTNINNNNNPRYQEFQVATAAGIATLPTSTGAPNNCAIGSICLCEAGWVVYILCADNTWKAMV